MKPDCESVELSWSEIGVPFPHSRFSELEEEIMGSAAFLVLSSIPHVWL